MIPCNGKKVNSGFINSISGDWKIFMEKDKNGQIFGDGCWDTSRRQLKSFSVQQFFKNAAEVWASSPHLRSKLFCNKFSLLQLHFFETFQFAIWLPLWNKLQIRTRQRGNCCTLAGKSRGGTPFCRMWKIGFPRSIVSKQQAAGNWKFFGAAVF